MPSTIIKHCWAKAGTVTMPGASGTVTIPVWGYSDDSCPCMIPGPIIEATEGDTVQVTLHNTLAEPVSMIFPGQQIAPLPVKDAAGRFISFTDHADPQTSVTYLFTAARPGTYRYESGTHPEKQVQMGLYGVLIVRPAGFDPSDPATWTAYGPDTRSEYDKEQALVLAELDSHLHATIEAGMSYDLLDYKPDWWTINGRAFPDTLAPDSISSQPMGARITATANQRILLRLLNAGNQHHSLHFGGLPARVVGEDGRPRKTATLDATYEKRTLTIASGQTYDVILVPTASGEIYIYDRDLHHATNESNFPGGMMTRVDVGH